MKRFLLLMALLLSLAAVFPGHAEQAEEAISEWTVMFYFCGSDLESGHSYATGNLEEISYCLTYDTITSAMQGKKDAAPETEDVNVVIETGGSKKWHAETLGMEVKTDRLQRWHFRPALVTLENVMKKLTQVEGLNSRELLEGLSEEIHDHAKIELEQEVPLASMAAPETLTDFIRWSAEAYPAKKYALVLWDHGTGARNGLLIDELYDGDTMRLDELKNALADSGVHFEAVLFDACLMANLETACAIDDHADWMIASEELVAGKGTAMYSWLQQLYFTPQMNGSRLGRWICDMTQEKYAAENAGQAEDTLTWSVIDLSKIDRLADGFDRFFATCNNIYIHDPDYMVDFCQIMNDSFEFGLGDANMIDLSRILYHPFSVMGLEKSLYTELVDALAEAVVYNTHGPNRASAGGLSFCYTPKGTEDELNAYARVCPSSHYLALLDAINPEWQAPAWVFEKAEKLPEIVDLQSYQIRVKKGFHTDGSPTFTVVAGFPCLWDVSVDVSWLNPASGNIVRLGRTKAGYELNVEAQQVTYGLANFTTWPTLEGVHCAAELASESYMGALLYNIPLMVGGENYMLRCGVEDFDRPPIVYGFWEGYNTDNGAFGRNVIPISKMAGQDFTLLYPIDGTEGDNTRYELSKPMTLFRSLEISSAPLKAGTYYLDFVVQDIFLRPLPLGRAEVSWDGKQIVTKKSTWDGEAVLTVAKEN